MAAVCLVPPDGHEKTLEAITIANEMANAGNQNAERFGPIVQGLLINNEQLRTNCMTLINAIITSPEDLDFRIHLRNEFLRVGLVDVLEVTEILNYHASSNKMNSIPGIWKYNEIHSFPFRLSSKTKKKISKYSWKYFIIIGMKILMSLHKDLIV